MGVKMQTTITKAFLASSLALMILLYQGSGFAQLVDRIVAIVNDEVITLSEFENEGKEYLKRLNQKPEEINSEQLNQAKEQILTKLINQRLITQEATKANIEISDKELERTFTEHLQKMNLSREEFLGQLQKSGLSENKYKDELRSKLLRDKLVLYEVRSKIVITEEMLTDYYNTGYTDEIAESGYYILQMGFKWDKDGDDDAESKKSALIRAEKAREMVIGGADFSTIARQESELPSAVDGGDLGIFQEDEMAQYMRQAILPLQVGNVSEIIETPIGYQFFKLLSMQKGELIQQVPFDTVKEEIRKKLFEKKFSEEYKEWVDKIKDESYVKRMLN